LNNTKCFALKNGGCIALKGRDCYECPFYKTAAEYGKSCGAAFARIAALPDEQQYYIATQYYGGTYPWFWGGLS
jgi:hypothetical protein